MVGKYQKEAILNKIKKILYITSAGVVLPSAAVSLTTINSTSKKVMNFSKGNLLSSEYTANLETLGKFVVEGNKNIIKMVDNAEHNDITKDEGRLFYHANHLPTGLLVRKGQVINVNIKEMNPGSDPRIWIEAPGTWAGLKNSGTQKASLRKGINKITANVDGIIYVTLNSAKSHATFEIDNSNLEKVPTFYKGDDENKFLEQIEKSNTPVVNIVSNWVVNMVGLKRFKEVFLTRQGKPKHSTTISKTLNKWDELVEFYIKQSGLSIGANGINKKHDHKISLFSSKGSFGWANSNGRVNIGDNWFNGTLRGRTEWIIGHEIGHTWQNPNMSWSSVVENVPNIFAALWQEKYHELSTKEKPWNKIVEEQPGVIENIKNAMNNGGFKKFNSIGGSEKLMMFLQLQKGFGENFMPQLSQYYRIHLRDNIRGKRGLTEIEKVTISEGLGSPKNRFSDIVNTTDEEKKQAFMRAVMDVTGYNLIDFFNIWGMEPNKETIFAAKDKMQLTKTIQLNYLNGTNPKNMFVQKRLSAYNPIQIKQEFKDMNIAVLRSETKTVTEKTVASLLKGKIPSNYKVEIIGSDFIGHYTRKLMVNIYDPADKFATENAFFIKVQAKRDYPKDSRTIPNYIFQDLVEIDYDKNEGDTGFISGLIIPSSTFLEDLWIFDREGGNYSRYNAKTTKLKDGMVIRLVLDSQYKRKFENTKTNPNAKFNEDGERIYLKSNGSFVYEKILYLNK